MILCFKKVNKKLQGFIDIDLSGDFDNCRSTKGFIFTMSSSTMSWMSKLQRRVVLSATKEEHMAISEVGKKII